MRSCSVALLLSLLAACGPQVEVVAGREAPASVESSLLSIESVGAVADGVTDSTPAFRTALATAASSQLAVTIKLAAGTYYLRCDNLPGVTHSSSSTRPGPHRSPNRGAFSSVRRSTS